MISEVLEFARLRGYSRLGPEALQQLRLRKLRASVRHAYERVPFYRDLYRAAHVAPEDIRFLEDIQRLPIVTKQQLRSAGEEKLIARGVDCSRTGIIRTSGVTGEPFQVRLTRGEARTRRLIEFRTLMAMGFSPRDKLAIVGPEHPRAPRLHNRLGWYRTEVIVGALPVEEQLRRLRMFQPSVLWAYPTNLRAILHAARYRLGALIRPRLLITSSEMFDPVMRQRVSEDLHCETFNFYAAMEIGRMAAECPAHQGLHVNADHVILECWDGERPAEDQQTGTVLVTTLNAVATPLIRYRLGDRCARLPEGCLCGSSFPRISAPEGRDSEMIRLSSGKLLPPGSLNFILRSFPGIDQFRLIQERLDRIVVQLVCAHPWSGETTNRLRARLLNVLREPVTVDVQFTAFMPAEGRKFKAFVSRLPVNQR